MNAQETTKVTVDTSNWYRYFGLIMGRVNVRVRLDSASLDANGSHAAVWAGVNSPNNRSWVQGGIEQTQGDLVPNAYIEAKINDEPGNYHFTKWPMSGYKIPMTVKLRRKKKIWHVTIEWAGNTHTSMPVKVPNVTIDACLELMLKCRAVCHINGHRVSGNNNAG